MSLCSRLRRLGVVALFGAALPLSATALTAQTTTFEPLGGPEAGFLWSVFVTDNGDVISGTRDSYSSAFRSTDGGATWEYVDAMPSGRYEAFEQLDNGDLIGASSNDVVRSTDGGETWASTANGFRFSVLSDLVQSTDGVLYASTYEGVARSTDGGTSWALANTGLDTLRSSAMAAGPSGAVYVAGFDALVHRSTDGGETWTPIYDGLPEAYVWSMLATSDGQLLVGSQAGFFRLPEAGGTWQRVTEGLGQDSTSGFYSFVELSSGRLLAASYWTTYISDDGGDTWTDPSPTVRPLGPYDMTVGGDGTVYAGSYGGGIYRSTTDGDSWTLSTSGITNPDVGGLGFDLDGHLLVGTLQSQTGNAHRWDPGAETWTRIEGINITQGHQWLRTSQDVLLAATGRGVYRSADGGATWTLSADVNTSTYSLAELPGDTLYAGTFSEGIARSVDGGATWTFLDSPLGRTTHLAVGPDGTVYAGIAVFGASDIEAGLIRSTDGGDTWTYTNGWGTTPRNPAALGVDSKGRLLASFGLAQMYRSDDRGDTWTNVEGLAAYTEVLHATGDDVLAAQRDGSVYRTSDGGETWTAVIDQPTGLYPRSLAVSDDGTIYLGTYGRGVFRSASGGSTANDDRTPRSALTLRAFPTPFQATTTIEIALPEAAPFRATVFDALGRRVATVDGGSHPPGVHRLRLDGASWPAGLYVVRVMAGEAAEAVRITKAR